LLRHSRRRSPVGKHGCLRSVEMSTLPPVA
jgi:hypothetical protein